MELSKTTSTVALLVAAQRDLEDRTREIAGSPEEVLAVGEALLAFAALETEALAAVLPLLDPSVTAELGAEHRQLAEDLDLLQSLLRNAPDSPDVAVLAASLARRMREHVGRDARLLARAAAMTASG